LNTLTQNDNYELFFAKSRHITVIALDCDGVLFDSREANIQFYSHIMEQVGRPPVRPDQQEYIHMHPVRESLLYLIGNDADDFDRAYTYFKKIDFGPFNGYLRREPGLIEFLEQAHTHFSTALATNRTISTLELLRQYDLSKYFDIVVSASDVQHPKPHPEIMERILSRFGADPRQVLYIGDSKVDETLAEATGVIFVGYKNPGLTADLHITHFRELNSLFSDPSLNKAQL
jgi:phosphoglycolate phosphatase